MKVKATDKYEKLNVIDGELGRKPKKGEVFEVTEERFEILNGKNKYKEIFVEEVIEEIESKGKKTNKKDDIKI